jgi:hypothetical protein
MRKPCAILTLAAMLFGSAGVYGQDHLVSPGVLGNSLTQAAAERARNLERLDGALASRRASQAAAVAGFDIDDVRASLAGLTNDEVRDLARRATAIDSDPTAGHYGDDDAVELLVIVALIGAIALVAIELADDNRR